MLPTTRLIFFLGKDTKRHKPESEARSRGEESELAHACTNVNAQIQASDSTTPQSCHTLRAGRAACFELDVVPRLVLSIGVGEGWGALFVVTLVPAEGERLSDLMHLEPIGLRLAVVGVHAMLDFPPPGRAIVPTAQRRQWYGLGPAVSAP